MDANALCYYKSAQDLSLPVKAIKELEGFELTLHRHHYFFCAAETPFNTATSVLIARHKYIANRLLESADIPVPKAILLDDNEFADGSYAKRLKHLNFPLVVKPLNERKGSGVLCNIQTNDELQEALTHAFSLYTHMIVEEYHANLLSYRVLVFNRRILGVILRHPACVIGNDTHNIEELIESTNAERKKINRFLGPITLDKEAHTSLKEQGIKLDYVPKIGEKIALGYTSNATRGGTYETVNKNICKENRKLMIRVANKLNLKLVGIDVQCSDINIPIKSSKGVIIECNDTPSMRIHEIPMYGPPTRVTRKIMRYFIYHHPFAYLHSLYLNKQRTVFLRSFLVALIMTLVYLLLPKGSI